jgi:hypothetical protein
MTLPHAARTHAQLPSVVMQPNSAIDGKLSIKTLAHLHTIRLPISEELGFPLLAGNTP